MRRGLITAVAALPLIAACTDAEPVYRSLNEYPGRQFAATSWDTLGWIGPADVNDTTLLSPRELTAWGDRLVVVEPGVSQVRAFGPDGVPLWIYGRKGAGPGELQQIGDLSPTPWGTLWILDHRGGKIVEIGPNGSLVDESVFRHFPIPASSVSFAGDDRIVFTANSPQNGLIFTSRDSLKVLATRPSPWADSVSARYNLRTAPASDPSTGTIVQALVHGPAFAVLPPGKNEAEVFPYIDNIPWALKASPRLSQERADSARYGALAADILDGEIYFLFGGRPLRFAHPDEPTVLVDVYRVDGSYRRSYLLPLDAEGLAVIGPDRFAVLGMHEGIFPRIYILRPIRADRRSRDRPS